MFKILSLKRLPNGSRGEETVKNKTKTQGKSFLYLFLAKMEFGTHFVYFYTFSYKFSPTNSHRVWACGKNMSLRSLKTAACFFFQSKKKFLTCNGKNLSNSLVSTSSDSVFWLIVFVFIFSARHVSYREIVSETLNKPEIFLRILSYWHRYMLHLPDNSCVGFHNFICMICFTYWRLRCYKWLWSHEEKQVYSH